MASPDLKPATELRGLALPATKGPGGYFESKSADDTAWGDLLLAILTPLGGRIMRRSLGSALYEQLFEPVVEGDFPLVDYTIRQAVDRQLSNVRIVRTEVREATKGLEVSVFFQRTSDLDVEVQRTVLVPKTFIGS